MDYLQMDSQQTFSRLLEELDYASSPNLISKDIPQERIPAELEATWREAKDKLGIDAVYFIANAPVIYFKRFEAYDQRKIAELHRNVWSQSKIPLIFVVLPNEIRVYSGYEAPKREANGFGQPSRLENELVPQQKSSNALWERLKIFTRVAIDSGSFWRDHGDKLHRDTRADQTLIANLRYIRRELIKDGLSPEHSHSLIGRSIFALYLQDRSILSAEEQRLFTRTLKGDYIRYTDLLSSYEDTYTYFDILREHFNGDMFPVTKEEKEAVQPEHLNMLRRLFTVDSASGGQMLFFWAYNFEFIPIELISSIYEEFLHQEENGRDGAYYTPPMLVDFILDQVMPQSDQIYKLSILDPACGSGIFLVGAYRRLVERWRRANGQYPKPEDLTGLLKSFIFGVDTKRQALRVAAFSLYLAMLDYVEPKSIWMQVRFPPLIGTNLIEADFFEERVDVEERNFDLVIGNPPWESQLTSHAKIFLDKRGYKVGDKQIAQAFILHAPDFCNSHGQIALLCSSKSLLFNKSGPNTAFRQTFFRKFAVTRIFDFSALRHFLFEKAVAPTAAILYQPQSPDPSTTIFYGAPKPTPLVRRFAALVIEANDIKQIPLRQVLESMDSMQAAGSQAPTKQATLFPDDQDEEDSDNHAVNIWKVALWGTSYDYILLQSLNKYPSLGEIIEKHKWISQGGFNRGGPGKCEPCKWLDNAPFIKAKDFTRFGIDTNKITYLPEGDLYYRRGNPEQFKAPLVLFKRTQVKRRIGAAYLDQDCTYTDSFTGIAGPEKDRNLLKSVAALLNSELAQYYFFLTSASWGVEREEIKAGEMKTVPFPFLAANEEQIATIAHFVDRLARLVTIPHDLREEEELERELNNHIYKCFLLNEQEIQHIRETIEYTIKFFNSPEKSLALQKPVAEMRTSYAQAYIKSINFYLQAVDRKLTSIVYAEEVVPLLTVEFSLKMQDANIPVVQEAEPDEDMHQVLKNLDRLSIETLPSRIYHRRNFKVYSDEGTTLYVVKPAERRLWTIGAALSDAEETIADLM